MPQHWSCTADTIGGFLQYDNDPAVAPMLHDGSNQLIVQRKTFYSNIREHSISGGRLNSDHSQCPLC